MAKRHTLESLQRDYPYIEWAKPVPVSLIDGSSGQRFACRICVANLGLHGSQVKDLWASEEAAAEHIRAVHDERD